MLVWSHLGSVTRLLGVRCDRCERPMHLLLVLDDNCSDLAGKARLGVHMMAADRSGQTARKNGTKQVSDPWANRFKKAKESYLEYVVSSGSHTIAKIVRAKGFAAPEHTHSEAQLSLFRKGTSAVFLTHSVSGRANQISVGPGSMAFMPPHQPHRTHWQNDGELMNVYFSSDFMSSMADGRVASRVLLPLSYRQETVINAIGRLLLDEFDRSGEMPFEFVDHARFLIATRLGHIMEAIASKGTSGMLSARRLQPALDFLHEHADDHTSLATLASLCDSSIFHFARSFRARFGSAPFVYQRALRLEWARSLLLDTSQAIEVVGSSVGFESASNFSRLFRRETGVSPSEYRRLHQSDKHRKTAHDFLSSH